jgi:hypothetical protein
MPPPAALMT